jgi:hypothetical protein
MQRRAFTLFELILAISLSATLLALIGTAVNLYLVRMDAGRTRVEEAQLARSILATIAADIRATTVYQTQDISSVEQLAQQSAQNNENILQNFGSTGQFTNSQLGNPSSAQSSDEEATSASGGLSSEGTSATGLAPGLNGLPNELMLDVARLPRLDEMYPTVQQQASSIATAAVAANLPKPSDLKSVRYFIRQGATADASDPAATLLSPAEQLKVGGLVRHTVDRAARQMAEQTANSQVLDAGQVLLAPEVTQIQFLYFDGTTAVDQWDMSQIGAMPTAVDVRIWITPDPIEQQERDVPLEPRMYNQTVELPLAAAASSAAMSGGEQESSDDESTEGSDEGLMGAGT